MVALREFHVVSYRDFGGLGVGSFELEGSGGWPTPAAAGFRGELSFRWWSFHLMVALRELRVASCRESGGLRVGSCGRRVRGKPNADAADLMKEA